jgi:hypothetical protein
MMPGDQREVAADICLVMTKASSSSRVAARQVFQRSERQTDLQCIQQLATARKLITNMHLNHGGRSVMTGRISIAEQRHGSCDNATRRWR